MATTADSVPATARRSFRWERTYAVPAPRLFEVVSDLDIYAEFAPNLARVDVLSGDGVGMVRQCTDPDGQSWRETYTDWVPGTRLATRVDVSTYPADLAAMIVALEMSIEVEPVDADSSKVVVVVDAELSDLGRSVFDEGGAADDLMRPILEGWGQHVLSTSSAARDGGPSQP